MVRPLLPRIPFFRGILSKARNPLLPTSRLRPQLTPLTNLPRSRLFHHFPARLNLNNPTPDPRHTLPAGASLTQRLRHLIKSYGWYALGVYFLLSVLDFGVAFAGINLLGADYVSRVAADVKGAVAHILHSKPPEPGRDELDHPQAAPGGGQEGLYAMLVLAYTIHKTLFVPVRVGLTAALTPRIVGWLSQRGWVGSQGTRRAATEMRDKLRERRSRNNQD